MIKDLINGSMSYYEVLNNYNAIVSFEKLPEGVNGFVFKYKDINNIIINEKLTYYKKKKAILHELAHIELDHLYEYKQIILEFKIDKIEDEADLYIKKIKEVECEK